MLRCVPAVVFTTAKCLSPPFFRLNRSSHGWKDPAGGICGGGLGPDPSGYNSAVENVLSVDGGAACSSRKECGDRGHVC